MRVSLASGAYKEVAPGSPARECKNFYLERVDTDPQRPMKLVKLWGSVALPDWTGGVIRGCAQADGFAGGKLLFVIGSALKTYDPDTGVVATITGSIAGSDRVQFTFTETECGILGGGIIHVSDGSSVRAVTDGMLDSAALAIGSTPEYVAYGDFDYSISSTVYSKGASAGGIAPGNDVVPTGLYGAVAFDINAAGSITAIEAPDNATGYASAGDAAAALPDVAYNLVRLGYVTASKSDGAFTFGTTALDAANTTVAYTSAATNTGWTDLLEAHDQTVFTSIAAIGQRLVATFGSRFGYSEVLNIASTTALNYYTAEYAPDGLVAVFVLGARLLLFGTQTLEEWYETGDADNPFRRVSGRVTETGCLCRDAIRKLDNTVYWVDRECSVRRLGNSDTPEIVSTPAISRAVRLETAANIIAWAYEADGHAFYGLRLTEGTYVFDPNTAGEWHTRETLNTSTWRYGYVLSAAQTFFVADFAGVGFAIMAREYQSEHMPDADTMGTEISGLFSGFAAISQGFEPVNSLRIEGSKGQGLSTGQGENPIISLRIWKGQAWSSWIDRPTGAQGAYGTRTIYRRLGIHRAPGFHFQGRPSDPVLTVIDGAAINED